jgi:alpha-ketoglutarate-dependent 2,4-dichlorophenoxyacetate dioxygenase
MFANEIKGITSLNSLTEENIKKLQRLLEKYSVLVLRNQKITNEQQVQFSEYFGPLEVTKNATAGAGTKTIILTNIGENNTIVKANDRQALNNLANQEWHCDSSFKKNPSKASILSARIIPGHGSNTEFLCMRQVYQNLPKDLKKIVIGKECWHDYSYGRSKIDPALVTDEERLALPPVKQSMVLYNPKYGASLYIGAHCSKIEGMDIKDSRKILNDLLEFANQKQFIYSHKWKLNDLIMWDNKAVMHRATPTSGRIEKRYMVRTTIAGASSTLISENLLS